MVRLSVMGFYCRKEQGKNGSCCIHRKQNLIHSCLFVYLQRSNGPTTNLGQVLGVESSQPKVSKSTVSLMSSWVSGCPSPALPFFWTTCIYPLFSQTHGFCLLPSFLVPPHLHHSTTRPSSLCVCSSSTSKDRIWLAWPLSLLNTMSPLGRPLEAVLWTDNHWVKRPIPRWVWLHLSQLKHLWILLQSQERSYEWD